MAPEQLEGKEADARSDLWALGCVLYEMATGRRAFEGEPGVADRRDHEREPRAAHDPRAPMAPPGARAPGAAVPRQGSRRSLADGGRPAPRAARGSREAARAPGCRRGRGAPRASARTRVAGGRRVAAVAAAALVFALALGQRPRAARLPPAQLPARGRLPGRLRAGRQDRRLQRRTLGQHAPDLHRAPRVSRAAVARTTGMHLLAVSSKGELAVLTGARYVWHRLFTGTLARMPLGGGAPREILEGVRQADWSPDGSAARDHPRGRGQGSARVPDRPRARRGQLPDRRPRLSAGGPARVLRAPDAVGRPGLGERRRPPRQEDRALGRLLERARPRLVAGRRGAAVLREPTGAATPSTP